MGDPAERYVDRVAAGPGGAMTVDGGGVITGDLTVATTAPPGGPAHVTVQYTGAEEWYVLAGSPVPVPPEGLRALHESVLERVRRGAAAEVPRPGPDTDPDTGPDTGTAAGPDTAPG
ncbi:hypothetical protein GCM10010218_49370 [Streptomyces mashuensis]|uniref:Uncharacterized protein n=1 Tax=Streptomyces mashuensis TaxID=33904 RepID=A0A919B8B9_9ACTN|nr:hypothetical protein [Streptomyces mashuensis]GHF61883.1 hypothetical protein GCM10010218_49370 [Streptomyces mashuensis]